MESGKLDRRVTIQRFTATTDDFGGETQTWADLRTVWAAVMPIRDAERFGSGEMAAHMTHRFQIRWGFGVTVEDRLIFDGRTFEITGVKEIGRRVGQEITASARAD